MSNNLITIYINGMKHQVEPAETISYEKLCKLAVQPVDYNPTATYLLGGNKKNGIIRRDSPAPLVEGTKYSVMITGNG